MNIEIENLESESSEREMHNCNHNILQYLYLKNI